MLPEPTPLGTVREWLGRHAKLGLEGLIDRTGPLSRRKRTPRPRSSTVPPVDARPNPPLSFVKWAGSKRQLIPFLLERMPKTFGKYYEPMVGSGALFLSLSPERAVLGDLNAELMNCFTVIRDRLDELVAALGRHENTQAHYLKTRGLDPDTLPEVERAARTIFLNKTCYNGLYRVNQAGRFNVPYGWVDKANFQDVELLERVHDRLQGVELRCGDFEETLRDAGEGDLVYLDPPYLADKRCTQRPHTYQPEAFGPEEHRRLARLVRELDQRGCHVRLSNSDVSLVRELYGDWFIEVLPVRRHINRQAAGRGGWTEVLVSNAPVRSAGRTQRPGRRSREGGGHASAADGPTAQDVHEVLLGYGPLKREIAIRVAARELREAGVVRYRELRSQDATYRAVERSIRSAIAAGIMDRPSRGVVRSIQKDVARYTHHQWRLCVFGAAPQAAVPRNDLLLAAARWAVDNLGLAPTRLVRGGAVYAGLAEAIEHAIRSGELERVGRWKVRQKA